jgi:hypothetical protein
VALFQWSDPSKAASRIGTIDRKGLRLGQVSPRGVFVVAPGPAYGYDPRSAHRSGRAAAGVQPVRFWSATVQVCCWAIIAAEPPNRRTPSHSGEYELSYRQLSRWGC